jgi:hypothetical protein
MSVFRVQLQNTQQGLLDLNPATATPILVGNLGGNYQGSQMNPSLQRTIFVTGPHRIYRELFDGQTFTDCNYWKRFAFPQVPLSQAFIQVVTDDGSIWSDFTVENDFPLTFGGAVDYNVLTTDTFATKFIDILGTYGSYANFAQITNLGTVALNQDVKVQLNGSANAVFNLIHGTTQVFNTGDLKISKLGFQLGGLGTPATTPIQVVLSVQAVTNS